MNPPQSLSNLDKPFSGTTYQSYESFVKAKTRRNPSLQNLVDFFDSGGAYQRACRIACLELSDAFATPRTSTLDSTGLRHLLYNLDNISRHHALQGRLLIIEDLSREVIELLGSALDIDPFFFAFQVDVLEPDIATGRPGTASLPSRFKSKDALTVDYHHVLEFNEVRERTLVRDANVPRKVKILAPIQGTSIGLARCCCSILQTIGKDGLWLGLILVDSPLRNIYTTKHRDGTKPRSLNAQSKPFHGGYEDFQPTKPSLDASSDATSPGRRSLLEDLLFYWEKSIPPGFDPQNPTLLSLAYYPLRIIAAEWMVYTTVMYHSIKRHERNPSRPVAHSDVADHHADLTSLQQWARRSMASSRKIRQVLAFLKAQGTTADRDADGSAALTEDYEHIGLTVDTYSRQLEARVPIVTSLIQIIDSQRSFAETANVTRLTYLALVFVPLTYVASLFSMNDALAPKGRLFGLYVVTAIPLSMVVFLLARPPARILELLHACIWRRKKSVKDNVG